MTIARAHLVDFAVTRWYHCITRCVQRAFLLGEGASDGKSCFLMLVDYTGRLFREGKATISREVAAIFERLGTCAETRQAPLAKLGERRFFGRFCAASRKRLSEVAKRLALRRVADLGAAFFGACRDRRLRRSSRRTPNDHENVDVRPAIGADSPLRMVSLG